MCDEAVAAIDFSVLTVVTDEWKVQVRGNAIYGRIRGPKHRLDLGFEPRVDERSLAAAPHGLVGQSYDGSDIPRHGKLDAYPALDAPGEFTTTAMAEGAIEGDATMYEVAAPHETRFAFSRFDGA